MNKIDLQRQLIEEKFNPHAYSLNEEQKDEALCLRVENTRWCIYYSEKGLQTGKEYFQDESSACAFFLAEMRSDPTTKIDWKSEFSM